MDSLHQQKWRKFLKRSRPLRYIPFVDLVFATGSLATGNMRKESDFDVIVGARQGRIFIARFFCFLVFRPLGLWARHPGSAKDKLCFNHFVTPNAYRLSPPYSDYWKKLYLSVVPILGDKIIIQRFYRANEDWVSETRLYQEDSRHLYKKSNRIKRLGEWVLARGFGDWLEEKLKNLQIRKIEKSLKSQSEYKPRIIYNDDELEFHPHTKRIEEYLRKWKTQ